MIFLLKELETVINLIRTILSAIKATNRYYLEVFFGSVQKCLAYGLHFPFIWKAI